ncbi:hypothetical protein [Kitasatospora aureofaciens]|uniref:hypothetical protein n=1 Tax=Kitasatospora aureofaciens TaxID=1894 RepID=UPI00382AB58F
MIRALSNPSRRCSAAIWSHPAGRRGRTWHIDIEDGPDHDQLLAALTHEDLGLDLELQSRQCTCTTKWTGCSLELTDRCGQTLVIHDRPGRVATGPTGQSRRVGMNERAFIPESCW